MKTITTLILIALSLSGFGQSLDITRRNITATENLWVRSDSIANTTEVNQAIATALSDTVSLDRALENDTLFVQTIILDGSVLISGGTDEQWVTTTITSANILAGDSILILPAPGPGKLNYIIDAVTYYDHGGTNYTVSANSYIYSRKDAANDVPIAINATTFLFGADYVGVRNVSTATHGWKWQIAGETYIGLNQPVWLQLGNHDTGNGTAIHKTKYVILDFN